MPSKRTIKYETFPTDHSGFGFIVLRNLLMVQLFRWQLEVSW